VAWVLSLTVFQPVCHPDIQVLHLALHLALHLTIREQLQVALRQSILPFKRSLKDIAEIAR
jgi:hypothetical protein